MTRLFLQLNRPGSGSTIINQNTEAASDIAFGKFIRIVYRGEDRGGFFVDDIDQKDASEGEEGEQNVEIKGRGMLGILDQIIVSYVNQGEATVTYSAKKIGFILDDLLTLGQGRGVYPNLIWDFNDLIDSEGESWTVNHDLSFRVGSTLLQAIDQFADLGVDFNMSFNPGADQYVLSAYKNGLGSDVSADVVFSPGDNVVKASKLQEASGLRNAQLIEVADPVQGPTFVWDTRPASIGIFGRLESYFQAGNAPTITEGLLLAAAELDEKADPRVQYSLVVSDANGPKVFEQYNIGDTVGYLNSEGTVDLVQVISLQLDFTKEQYYADVTVGLGVLIIDTEITSALKLKQIAPGVTGIAGGPSDPAVVAGALIGIHDADVTAHSPYLRNANKIQGFDIVDPGIDTPDNGDLMRYVTVDAEWKYFTFSEAAFNHDELAGLGDDDHTQYLLIDGTRAMTGNLDMDDNAIVNLSHIDFDLVNGVAAAEGRMVWNDDEGTLNIGLKGGNVNLQVGQELVLRGRNTTGTGTIDGKPARITGATGAIPDFGFSEADVFATAGMFGLFTEDVANMALGYVTTTGLVRDVDTSGTPYGEVWAAGDSLFVGDTAGSLTKVYPSGISRVILAGAVLRAHATEGVILVNVINTPFLPELSGVTISGVADNELLAYDTGTTTWINQTPTEAGLDARYVEITGDTMTGTFRINKDTAAGNQQIISGFTNTNKNLIIGFNTTGDYAAIQAIEQTVSWRPLVLQQDAASAARVGIGEIAPDAKFQVSGGADIIQTIIKGNATQNANLIEFRNSADTPLTYWDGDIQLVQLGSSAFGLHATPASNVVITVNKIITDIAGTEYGIFETLTSWPSQDTTTTLIGAFLGATSKSGLDWDVASLRGVQAEASHIGTGHVDTMIGGTLSSSVALAGSVGTMYGMFNSVLIAATSTGTTLYGNFIDITIAGTVTNATGIYVSQVSGATTLNRAIVTEGGDILFNLLLSDSDLIVASDTEANLLRVDGGEDEVRLGDWDTNYFTTNKLGDSWWVGGGGLPFGHCYGNEIDWTQANAAQNTWYDISDADMISGNLHLITHDGNGQLTVSLDGMYDAVYDGAFEASAANVHIQVTFSVNGTEVESAINHFETIGVNRQSPLGGNTILDLSAADTVNLSIRTTDAGTPDLSVDHLMFKLVQVGGT